MPIYKKKDKNGKIMKNEKGIELWYFRDYYTDVYGNRKQYKSGLIAGKKEVQEAERDWLNNLYKDDINNSTIMFIDAYNEWLLYRKKELKESSYYTLWLRAEKYMKPFFKDYRLHYIKTNTINQWYKNIDKLKGTARYKNRMIKDLKMFLHYCQENYNYDYKAIANIQSYRIDNPIDSLKESEWNFWTYDEWKKFIKCVDNYEYRVMFSFMYFTGVRFGEFNALNWNDFDQYNKTIKITKSLTNRVVGKLYVITTPKTKNSIRIIDLDDEMNNMLIEYKKYKEKNYYNFNDEQYIFGDIKYVSKTTFVRMLNKYIEISGVRHISPHGFRHSHASLLIDLGCDSREVADRLGDTVSIVESVYYHIFPQKQKNTVKKLNNISLKK